MVDMKLKALTANNTDVSNYVFSFLSFRQSSKCYIAVYIVFSNIHIKFT